ncbi:MULTISPECIES: hypothetical protein [unclassified Streptomyces]|uniref:hypothetical protein n=1 Tax=unclassified Streptomyces TaxID=2593676 RepID=UPI00168A4261|nr:MULTISPECIES: hypothetical protein [unclassified Streptomyces]MBD3008229.1 hypothetical protein [Streptomyces sp. 5-10]
MLGTPVRPGAACGDGTGLETGEDPAAQFTPLVKVVGADLDLDDGPLRDDVGGPAGVGGAEGRYSLIASVPAAGALRPLRDPDGPELDEDDGSEE